MKEKLLRGSHAIGLAARIVISVVIIAVIIWKFEEFQNIDVRGIVSASGSLGIAIASILGIYLLKAIVFVVPASLVYIAVGLALPTFIAIPVNIAGILLEVCVTYLLGMMLGGNIVTNKLKKVKYGDKILALHEKNKLSAIFAIRVLPIFPIDIVSLFLGAVKMKFVPYLLISLAGILPRVILFTILGDGLYDYIPMQKLMVIAAVLVPVALIIWIIRYALKSKKSEEIAENPPEEDEKDKEKIKE